MDIFKCQRLIWLCATIYVTVYCTDVPKNIAFMTDYIKWRKINYMIIVDKPENAVSTVKMAKDNLNTFVSKNIYFTLHTSLKYSEVTLNQTKVKIGIITFLESNFSVTDFLEQANKISRYGEKAAWLIVDNCHYLMTIMEKLRYASFDLNADIVIAADPIYSLPLTLVNKVLIHF
uniref:Uncharacterized protein LOC114336057 n=1 Tax=Diabrotica virgifera virgifera TaxID=50390 RepID=A0A6P7GDA1_DIAVI